MASKHKRDLLKIAQAICPEATLELTRGDHLCVTIKGPKGQRKVFAGATPSCHRAIKNVKRLIANAAREVGCLPERD